MLRRIFVGTSQQKTIICVMTLCSPNFLSVDHPFVTVEYSGRLDTGEIATRIGFTETLSPTHLAAQNFWQELLLLFFGAVLQQRRPDERVAKKIGTHRRASIGELFGEHYTF